MGENKPTYYDLLNFFHNFGFPELLSLQEAAIIRAILQRWNDTRRQKTFRMSNPQLSRLSGIKNNITRYRKGALEEFVLDETCLIEYKSRGQHKSGVYTLHYEIISDKYLNEINLESVCNQLEIISEPDCVQLPHDFTHDLREEKSREEIEEESLSTTPTVVTTPSKEVAVPERDDDRYKKILRLMNKACPSWHPSNEFVVERVEDIMEEFPDHQIEEVVIHAGKEGVKAQAFLKYVENGLKDFEKYYGAKAKFESSNDLMDARMELESSIRGHDHLFIYGYLKKVAELSDKLIEKVYDDYIPHNDDNYHSLDRYKQIHDDYWSKQDGSTAT